MLIMGCNGTAETPASKPRSYGEEKNEGFSDPSAAFPGAPVDRKVEEPGYGQDLKCMLQLPFSFILDYESLDA